MPGLNRAIKVLLVDDEEKTRNLIKLLVDWEELGFILAGEASSGQEGLHMLEDVQPDLIITDIKMPYMNGLEFSKLVKQQYPEKKIIILSAYEDFAFAQQGIQLGISDYLLKPIKREKLKIALLTVRSVIDGESDVLQEYVRMKEQLTNYRSVMQEKFLNEMLLDRPAREIEQKMSYFSMEELKNYVQVAVVACREEYPEFSGEKKIIYDMVGEDIVNNYFQSIPGVYVFTDQMENIVIANTDQGLSLQCSCEEIKNIISAKMMRNVSVGIGTACSGIHGLAKSYQEACEALKYCIIYGDKVVLYFKDVSVMESGTKNRENCLSDIEFFVRAGLREEATQAIHRNLEQQPLEAIEDINAVRVNGINLITLLVNIASDMKLPFDSGEFSKLYADIITANSVSQMEACLISVASRLIASVQSVRKKKNSKLVDKILKYIDENMSDPALGLSSLSAHFYLNPSYLSRTFKQQVGYTVVEYLTKQRIERAKELLKNDSLMAYEIGETVGIPEPNYFGKCFKKYEGCSIQEYRKRLEFSALSH
jgi:two-component system response regulator YesN